MALPRLPASAFRNDSIYRSIRGEPAPVHGCGIISKPTHHGDYANRTIPNTLVAVYVLRGTGSFTDPRGTRHRVVAGDLILMPANRPHGVQQDADGRWIEAYLTMNGGFGDMLFRLGVLDRNTLLLHPGLDMSLYSHFERILADLHQLADDALPGVLAQAHQALATAAQLHRQHLAPDRHQQMIQSACILLSQNLRDRVDMEAIATSLGIGYERFRKVFRQRVGLSPGDYRIRRRIDRARLLIFQDRLSNKQVAYELGYPDPFTFSKQFHKVVGVWPDEYRRPSA